MVLGTITSTYAFAFSLRYKRNAAARSETVFFLGCLLYGAGIWLVAQAFHINSHYPDGVWWWAIGVLPFGDARSGRASPASGSVKRARTAVWPTRPQ